MSKPLKFLLTAIVIFFTAVVALTIYVVTWDPNAHKDWIAERFRDSTGRALRIGGDIGLTWYPWLGLSVEDLEIGNAEGFGEEPFLRAGSAVFRVKLMPILQGRYEVDTVRLYGAALNLEVGEDGRSNWEDLAGSGEEQEEAAGEPVNLANVNLGGVDIRDGSVVLDDRLNGARYEVSGFRASTGPLVYGEPIALDLAFDASSSAPRLAVQAALQGTLAYDDSGERYDLAPLALNATLSGPGVPGGSAELNLASALMLDLGADTLSIPQLRLEALDGVVEASLEGRGIQSESAEYRTTFSASGRDLAVFFHVLENQALAERIAALDSQEYALSASVDFNAGNGGLVLRDLRGDLLGATLAGDLEAAGLGTEAMRVNGDLSASGPDLPTLVEVAGQVQGRDSALSEYGRQLSRAPDKRFAFEAVFEADMAAGEVRVPTLDVELLGADIRGELTASSVDTDTPRLSGALNASGPDLPLLLQIAGQLQGGTQAPLNVYGRQLREGVADRAFTVDASFDADLARGDIQVPVLTASLLGFQLDGTLATQGMAGAGGQVEGSLNLSGGNLSEVLAAIGQADLAEVAQSVSLDMRVGGSRRDLAIGPLDLGLVLSGPSIANSPATLRLTADSRMNLDEDTLDLRNFRVNGLGLDLSGTVAARNVSQAAEFSGNLSVQPFDLRALLRQLNQEPPVTADPAVLQRVALDTAFSGSASNISLSELALVLDDSTLRGSLAVSEFGNPAITFDLDVDQIDADRYLAPAGEEAQAAGAPAEIPAEPLRNLQVDGHLDIASFAVANLDFSDFSLDVDASGGQLRLVPSTRLYEGSFTGEIGLDVRGETPAASISAALSTVALGPLLQDLMDATYLSGKGNLELQLQTSGADSAAMLAGLDGGGRVALEDGVLQGVDVGSVLTQVELMIRERRLRDVQRGESTSFNAFSATLAFNDGVVTSDDLILDAEGFAVSGRGTLVNLSDDSIAFNLVADVKDDPAASEQYDIGGYSLPIACTGNLAAPRCLPDTAEIVRTALSDAVQRNVTDLLDRALGGGREGTQQGQQNQPAAPEGQQQQPPAQENDAAEEILNRAIENIFRRN